MRKASREVHGFTAITDIISSLKTINLGMISKGEPYVVPLSFGFDTEPETEQLVIYLHSAKEGRKIDALKENPFVSFSMSSELNYSESGPACTNPSYYRSVMGTGTVTFITDPAEKEHALRTIIRHMTGNKTPVFAPGGIDATCIMRLDVKELSGKQNLPAQTKNTTAKPSAPAKSEAGKINSDAELKLPEKVSAYVDGSYDNASGRFSYGCVILDGDIPLVTLSEAFDDPELATMHNVAGEIKGAEAAMRYCMAHGVKELTIYHDYEGIAKWCLGLWKANKMGTIAYRNYYREICTSIKIEFVKVKGHSGNTFNDMADKLAGEALK